MGTIRLGVFAVLGICGCTGGGGQLPCEELDPEGCEQRSDCSPLDGRELIAGEIGECWEVAGSAEPLGCMDAESACPPQTIAGSPPGEDVCYEFAAGCLPEGWERCEDVYACG